MSLFTNQLSISLTPELTMLQPLAHHPLVTQAWALCNLEEVCSLLWCNCKAPLAGTLGGGRAPAVKCNNGLDTPVRPFLALLSVALPSSQYYPLLPIPLLVFSRPFVTTSCRTSVNGNRGGMGRGRRGINGGWERGRQLA